MEARVAALDEMKKELTTEELQGLVALLLRLRHIDVHPSKKECINGTLDLVFVRLGWKVFYEDVLEAKK
jgi:hypothetical protein